jgi:hypothetical protein
MRAGEPDIPRSFCRAQARNIERPSANMRANGMRSLAVSWHFHHEAVLSADRWPDNIAGADVRSRMVCTRCGIIGADARPNWREQPARESWHIMRRSDQQCGPRSDRRTGMPLARSRGVVQVPVERT